MATTTPATGSRPTEYRHRLRLLVSLLLLVSLGAAAVVAWRGQSRVAAVEADLRRNLAEAGADVPVGDVDALVRRAGEMAQEAIRLRASSAQLGEEEARRQEAERDLASAQERAATGQDESERLRAELSQAGQAGEETARGRDMEQAEAGQEGQARQRLESEVAERDRALAEQRGQNAASKTKAQRTQAALGGERADDAGREAALAGAQEQLQEEQARALALEEIATDLDAGPRDGGTPLLARTAPSGEGAPALGSDVVRQTPAGRALATFQERLSGHDRLELLDDNRVVVRSSTLFPQSGVEISGEGREVLGELARRLNDVASGLPMDLSWGLRVEGHADDVPVREDAAFASNWQLSAVRASSVVDFLVEAGVPARRLAVTAFGNVRPLIAGTDEEARERNRRIEIRFVAR